MLILQALYLLYHMLSIISRIEVKAFLRNSNHLYGSSARKVSQRKLSFSLNKNVNFVLRASMARYTHALSSSYHSDQVKFTSFSHVNPDILLKQSNNNCESSSVVVKKPNDRREYRAITLENGIRVLLISDSDSQQAAAALDVHVGSFSDPVDLPGLAHFCEHMSFLGTKKHSEEDGFSKFLSSHGGSANAYTDAEDTLYYFDVNAEYMSEALDRFSQFFIAPLFSASATERELNAIESEHSKNINNNGFRVFQLGRDYANPAHVLNRFATGNKDTLDTIPRSKGIDVREALLSFHEKYYSASLIYRNDLYS